jgi:hypothetical protein
VRDDDDLPPQLGAPEAIDKFIEDGLRVEVLFGLVDDERPIIIAIKGQVQQQEDNAARTWRQLLDADALGSSSALVASSNAPRPLNAPAFRRSSSDSPRCDQASASTERRIEKERLRREPFSTSSRIFKGSYNEESSRSFSRMPSNTAEYPCADSFIITPLRVRGG